LPNAVLDGVIRRLGTLVKGYPANRVIPQKQHKMPPVHLHVSWIALNVWFNAGAVPSGSAGNSDYELCHDIELLVYINAEGRGWHDNFMKESQNTKRGGTSGSQHSGNATPMQSNKRMGEN
jgi:hypothetical protein